jgi:hypothetical protein
VPGLIGRLWVVRSDGSQPDRRLCADLASRSSADVCRGWVDVEGSEDVCDVVAVMDPVEA